MARPGGRTPLVPAGHVHIRDTTASVSFQRPAIRAPSDCTETALRPGKLRIQKDWSRFDCAGRRRSSLWRLMSSRRGSFLWKALRKNWRKTRSRLSGDVFRSLLRSVSFLCADGWVVLFHQSGLLRRNDIRSHYGNGYYGNNVLGGRCSVVLWQCISL